MIRPKILSDEEIVKAKGEAERLYWTHKPHPMYEKEKHLLQAQNDYSYKGMLKQFREWGFSACPHDPSNLQARKAYCPECWQILLEEEG